MKHLRRFANVIRQQIPFSPLAKHENGEGAQKDYVIISFNVKQGNGRQGNIMCK